MKSFFKRLWSIYKNIVYLFDCMLNCCFRLGKEWGYPGESLSARAFRQNHVDPRYEKWINRIVFWDYEETLAGKTLHCELAFRRLLLLHLPKEYSMEGYGKYAK
jgi:hypothetical protein